MANRAYLFSSNLENRDAWVRPEHDYYDSRWWIPASWFFLFRPANIRLVDVTHGEESWQEVKLFTERNSAILLFKQRLPLLRQVFGAPLPEVSMSYLIQSLKGWSGTYLLMDPEEVFGGLDHNDTWHATTFKRILVSLEDSRPDIGEILADLQQYSDLSVKDADAFVTNVIGCTYW